MCSICSTAVCQNENIGWYHLLSGAKTRVLTNYVDPKRNVAYAKDEILLFFDFKGNIGYAIDIDGRVLEITDTSKIKKIVQPGRVVKMIKDIDISLDKTLGRDNDVWIIGFNSSANTARVLLASGEIVEIPKDSYIDIRDYYLLAGKNNKANDVVDH
jgi:hypothetical protein